MLKSEHDGMWKSPDLFQTPTLALFAESVNHVITLEAKTMPHPPFNYSLFETSFYSLGVDTCYNKSSDIHIYFLFVLGR